MNLLAFDTSTETLSIAVRRAAQPPLEHVGAGGAQASAALIPAIHSLLGRAQLALRDLDAIVFGRGPGSFTGLRTACSVAQGLGFGAGVPLLPVDTLLAVAEDARASHGAQRVVAVLDARMGEVYFGAYAFEAGSWRIDEQPQLGRAQDVRVPQGWVVAGNAMDGLAALPSAAALLRAAPALLAAGQAVPAAAALPLYIRDKVAQTTDERARARAATPDT